MEDAAVTEIRFYHLEQRTSEQALPALVEEAFGQRVNVIVEAPDRDFLERLDDRLWSFSDDSFLPHAIAGNGADESQPILLTTTSENRNGATMRFLLAGAKAGPSLAAAPAAYDRIVVLFNGSDEEEIAGARAQWAELKAAGRSVSYWRQGEGNGWEKVR
jgi:DNA polymerase III subunit chi